MADETTAGANTPAVAQTPAFSLSSLMSNGALLSSRQLALIALVAIALAAVFVGMMWIDRSNYRAVYPGLTDQDASAVVGVLEAAGIPVRIDQGSGDVEVPTDHLYSARFKLAAEGLPRGGSSGMEYLWKDTNVGSSEFTDNARHRNALETEIARTIATLRPVQSARVHLALPRQSAFVRESLPPTASVVLTLFPGRTLDRGQISAISYLVSSAVPRMTTDGVSIMDHLGRPLSGPNGVTDAMDSQQLDMTRRQEQAIVQRIEQILRPLVGIGNVRAEVAAQLDFTELQRTEERYDERNRPHLVSEQVTRQGAEGAEFQAVAAGALANEPPGAEANQDAQAEDPQSETQSVRNFKHDRTVSVIKPQTGGIKKLMASVVINHLATTGEDGKVVQGALTPEQLAQYTELVKNAMGFDEARGDTVQVVNQPFLTEIAEEAVPLWEQAWVLSWVKLLALTIVALLVLFIVVRPIVKVLLSVLNPPPGNTGGRGLAALGTSVADDTAGYAAAAVGPEVESAAELLHDLAPQPDYHADIRLAQRVASNDPRRAAQVVKRWLENGGS